MKWEDPPEAAHDYSSRTAWAREAAELRANPGRWAVITECSDKTRAYSLAHNIRQGRLKAFRPEGSFSAKARTQDGVHKVYARYVKEGP